MPSNTSGSEAARQPHVIYQLGWGLGEHAFATGSVPQFGITKEEAIEQIGALTRDRDFIKRYLSGNHEGTVKMKTLHAAAHW